MCSERQSGCAAQRSLCTRDDAEPKRTGIWNQNEQGFGTKTNRDLEQAACLAAGQAVVVASAPAAALEENAPFEAG
jgi:hypothetical protein